MIRKLLMFSGVAIAVSIGCLAGASYLLRHDYGTWTISNEGHVSHFQHTSKAPVDTSTKKALTWSGENRLEVNLPGDVDFTQGATPEVTVSGPAALVERVHLEGGRLWMADGDDQEHVFSFTIDKEGFHARDNEDRLRVSITAPGVSAFDVTGSGQLKLRNLDLPTLDVSLSGSGDVTAEGRAAKLALDISGSGDADMSRLVATEARIGISGSGNAEINAKDKADVAVSGSGDVEFTGRPETVNTSISGSGSVE